MLTGAPCLVQVATVPCKHEGPSKRWARVGEGPNLDSGAALEPQEGKGVESLPETWPRTHRPHGSLNEPRRPTLLRQIES
jgi:hypothetical protein